MVIDDQYRAVELNRYTASSPGSDVFLPEDTLTEVSVFLTGAGTLVTYAE
jgi:hypothetical protein